MTRVAANQDQSEALRKQFVCRQHIHIITRKSGGKEMREETTEYNIVPTATGTQKQLKLFAGRYWHSGKYEDFKGEPVPEADSWDADYIRDVRMCLTGEKCRCELAPQDRRKVTRDIAPVGNNSLVSGHSALNPRAGRRTKTLVNARWLVFVTGDG